MLVSDELTLNVSQEFFKDGFISDNVSALTDKFRNFFTAVDDDNNFIGGNQIPNSRQLGQLVKHKSYADTRTMMVRVPVGLASPYLDYLDVMEKAVSITDTLVERVLVPFTRYLAVGLADPDTLASSGASVHLKDFKPSNVDGVALELGKCFTQGSGDFERRFGDVFERNGDVPEVYRRADELVARFIKTRKKDVQQKVNEMSELLDTLIKRIEDKDANYQPSAVTTTQLSKLSYTVAHEIEFYGTVGYQLMALTVALKETEQALKKQS